MNLIVEENDIHLLHVRDMDDDTPGYIISGTRAGHQSGLTPEMARLIAAAPDLLEVLKKIRTAYTTPDMVHALDLLGSLTPQIDAAIELAECEGRKQPKHPRRISRREEVATHLQCLVLMREGKDTFRTLWLAEADRLLALLDAINKATEGKE